MFDRMKECDTLHSCNSGCYISIVSNGLMDIFPQIPLDDADYIARLHYLQLELEDCVDYSDPCRRLSDLEQEYIKKIQRSYRDLFRKHQIYHESNLQHEACSEKIQQLIAHAMEMTYKYNELRSSQGIVNIRYLEDAFLTSAFSE